MLDSVGTGDAGRLGVAELILELGEASGWIGGDGEVNGLSGERVGLAGGEGKGSVRVRVGVVLSGWIEGWSVYVGALGGS